MVMNRKLVGGVVAVLTGSILGCSIAPSSVTTAPNPDTNLAVQQLNPADTEGSLTRQEQGLPDKGQYSVQQAGWGFGHPFVFFPGRRCRWFWVPSTWGWDWNQFDDWWNTGRWVLVCRPRFIPWWWFGGPFFSPGIFAVRPHFRPIFPFNFFIRFRRPHHPPFTTFPPTTFTTHPPTTFTTVPPTTFTTMPPTTLTTVPPTTFTTMPPTTLTTVPPTTLTTMPPTTLTTVPPTTMTTNGRP